MHFLIQTKSGSRAWNRLSTVSKLNQVISQRVLSSSFVPVILIPVNFSVVHFYQVDVLKDLNVSRSLNFHFDSVIPASLAGVFLHLTFLPSWYVNPCLLYTSDAADDLLCVDLGGRRIIKKKKNYQREH